MEKLNTLQPGRAWPLGAHSDGAGVNFAVFSHAAQRVELCLFDAEGRQELSRTPMPGHTHDIWHAYLPGAAPGLVYGLRVHGPWWPDRGHRCNPNKVLLDPYAREIVGRYAWHDEHFGADLHHPGHMDSADNAAVALKARVVADHYDWQGDGHLHTPLADTVLYEVHVRGYTRLLEGVPPAWRGTYAGLASEASIAHLRRLGVSAVNLLPVHQCLDEQRLVEQGLSNYWGYNTIGFFCPDPRLASATDGRSARDEFRTMVRRLHAAGIEVILDVVYNHTAEGNEHGPTLSFRGLDNASYYRLPPHARMHYENVSGCGNALDLRHPRVLQLVMDSLRYWAGDMHVDGFRFDLAPVLGRGDHGFDARAAFFSAIAQDPLLSRLKLIAEPWDVGHSGYQLGAFPPGWLEWNDRFRDTMRAFWVHRASTRGDFALRLCGSSDIFQPRGRMPSASVNYCVSHDGFTLADLVSYEHKHNHANGEDNRDGHAHNHSANFGVEGPSDDAAISARRRQVKRALLATTLLAQGTPMLAAGDEFGHSQRGNNNPYCQDNVTTWLDWSRADDDLIDFTARVLRLRRAAGLHADRWYDGVQDVHGLADLSWIDTHGDGVAHDSWHLPDRHVLGCLIARPPKSKAPLLLLINSHGYGTDFTLPGGLWQVLLASAAAPAAAGWHEGRRALHLPAHSLTVLGAAGHEVHIDAPHASA
ncbi:MAG: glycogen debranching protein GlgX [Rhodocyclaceae bacterium]|nr:glycogen debranching protein GlgX [Rhodocyclaceae bacterium]